jgi:hypothetical protein
LLIQGLLVMARRLEEEENAKFVMLGLQPLRPLILLCQELLKVTEKGNLLMALS